MAELWRVKPLEPGDHIRVNRGQYYHHGIYLGNGEVAHYCAENGDGITTPDEVSVRITPISRFTDGFCETRDYKGDKRKRRTPEQITAYARSKEGIKGYDILNNNCEHFANECVYGEGFSNEVESVRSKVRALLGKTDKNK